MPKVDLPNIDAMLLAFFGSRLLAPVHMKVPDIRPESFVRVWRVGGGAMNRVVDQPLITVQAWARSDLAAHDLAAECRDLLLNDSAAMPLVRRVEIVSGPYLDPDPDSKTPRYTVTARMIVRGRR